MKEKRLFRFVKECPNINFYHIVTSLRYGDNRMDWLAQASETNTRYAVPNIGPDPVTYINIYNYQAVSRHCDSEHIFKFEPVKN